MAKFLKKFKQNFSFQNSEMKNSKFKKIKNFSFSFQIFVTYFKISNFNPNFKIDFFNFFHFLWPIFSKFKNKNFNSNFKNDFFQNFSFLIFLMTWRKIFLSSRLPNLLKDCKNYLFTLKKIVLYSIPPLDDMVHRKRAPPCLDKLPSASCRPVPFVRTHASPLQQLVRTKYGVLWY
jgi:hypothetical protein